VAVLQILSALPAANTAIAPGTPHQGSRVTSSPSARRHHPPSCSQLDHDVQLVQPAYRPLITGAVTACKTPPHTRPPT